MYCCNSKINDEVTFWTRKIQLDSEAHKDIPKINSRVDCFQSLPEYSVSF